MGEDTFQVTEVCFEKEGGGTDICALSGCFWCGYFGEEEETERPYERRCDSFWSTHHLKLRKFWKNTEGCNMRKKQVDSLKEVFMCAQPD